MQAYRGNVLAMTNEHEEVKGRAKGGVARAQKLTPERRSEIAREAALVRHGHREAQLPKATHKGVLKIADLEIPCFVLDDGRRVISGRGMTAAIGMKGRGQGVARIGGMKAIRSNKNHSLLVAIENPIRFLGESPKIGVPSDGFEATVLQELCESLLAARDARLITTEHERRYVQFAEALIRAFARVGIVALVDEATGYQAVRPKDALQRYLEMLIRKELAAWAKKFPDEFYENIYKLRGWKWPGISKNRYSVVAHYTRDLVYERMAPGLLKELENKSPKDDQGNRESKLHQWLTDDVGDPMLASHLQSLLTLQRLALANGWGWIKFVRMVDQVMAKKGQSLLLPFGEDEEEAAATAGSRLRPASAPATEVRSR
jgi:hypothetical protein